MSVERIALALLRRVIAVPEKILWNISPQALKNRKCILKYKDIHKGKRCFLIANGPSLKKTNLDLIKNEITFGMNRIYLNYSNMSFKPTYLVCVNKLLLQQFSDEIKKQEMPLFINWQSRRFFKDTDNVHYIERNFFGKNFSDDISFSLNGAATVTYAALQVIYYMGFDTVVIIGMDHNFTFEGKPNQTQSRVEDNDVNHFHPNYFPKGVKWETPDLISSEYYYAIADKKNKENGRHIYDATIGGKCYVFDKIDYSTLFS
jgi:hypothetical protein